MQDQKVENLLNLALDATLEEREKSLQLNVGYDAEDNTWEVLVKYSGDLRRVLGENVGIVELLNGFAILTVPEGQIDTLTDLEEIEYVEKPKSLFFAVSQGRSASCMNTVQSEFSPLGDPLTGKGVLVACVDSGIDYAHPDFRNPDGSTRILRFWDQSLPGNPPAGYQIGTEFTKEDLDRILLEEEENIIQRMDSLEKRKIICGYHTVINWDKASRGRKVMAIIEVGVTPQRDYGYDKIAKTIARYPEVDTMYLLSGKSEFMCMVYGKSMYDVASFVADKIACIDAVKSTVTLFVLKQYKESGIILEDERKHNGERLVVTP